MTGEQAAITITGMARDVAAGGAARPVRIDLAADRLTIALDGSAPVAAAYRDVTTIAADQGRVLVVLGPGSTRLIVEQLGASLGTLIGEVRERRAREQLHDRFIELPPDERLDLAEYRIGDEHGVAQLAYHGWGFGLLPVDERRPWRLVRRADIDAVEADPASGRVVVRERRRSGAEAPPPIELLGLGADVERHRARLAGLRDGALSDAAAIVARLMPDAPFEQRQRAGTRLVDGRAASAADLGDAWPQAEAAVLGDPIYAAAYRALLARGAPGDAPLSWLALAPRQPGNPDEHMAWFFVGLPGNLLAFELVSEGAHATYLYRILPRAQYAGQSPAALAGQLASAVLEISECLIDTRFLREPIYMTDQALADARFVRYRMAIAALPSLRAARSRFVGRVIHRDDQSWSKALDDAVGWNGACRDDGLVWPAGAPSDATDEQEQPASGAAQEAG